MSSLKPKKNITAAVFSSVELCIIDSFAMFKNHELVDLLKASDDRVAFSIAEYDLIAIIQDDNSLKVQFNEGAYTIKVESKATNFSGTYHFFHCIECDVRARKLYCIKGRYLCRKCGHLGYYSQKLNFYDRLSYMQIKIEATLKSKGGSLDRKPPWMKCRTFEALKLQRKMYEARYYYAAEVEFARQIGGKPPNNLLGLIPLASEMALSLIDKEKLMKIRQVELDKLQQDIFDTHLTLVLHITELIDRRDLAKQQLQDVNNQINEEVIVWNRNNQNLSVNVAIAHYKTLFNWLEMLDNLEFKIKELTCVISYYQKLKSHFFMTKTTNFIDVFNKQAIINKVHLEQIVKDRASWFSNIKITEDFLRGKNSLTHQFVDQCKLTGKQYRAERDKNPIVFAQKRNDDIKNEIKKASEDKKRGGGGGPEKDPGKKPQQVIGYAKNVFTHAFNEKSGHLIDTPTNRILILEMASNIKNFLIEDVFGNDWYAEILKDGTQFWAWARDGLIKDCGINQIPRAVTEYGLCKNPLI